MSISVKVFLEMINWGSPILNVGENSHSFAPLLPGHWDVKSGSVSRLPCHDGLAPLETSSQNKFSLARVVSVRSSVT